MKIVKIVDEEDIDITLKNMEGFGWDLVKIVPIMSETMTFASEIYYTHRFVMVFEKDEVTKPLPPPPKNIRVKKLVLPRKMQYSQGENE